MQLPRDLPFGPGPNHRLDELVQGEQQGQRRERQLPDVSHLAQGRRCHRQEEQAHGDVGLYGEAHRQLASFCGESASTEPTRR